MKYQIEKYKEKIGFAIAWMVPKWLAYYCTVRVACNETTGIYSNQVVPELTIMDAMKRWN